MIWADPWNFLWLIPVLAVVVWAFSRRGEGSPTLRFSYVKLFAGLPPTLKARLWFLPPLLKILGIAFLVVAMARPQEESTSVKRNVEGIDIMIALDISDSMMIEDMQPSANRLEASKKTIKEFIEGRTSDRIGLVVFSGESYTRVPLTLDYPLLLKNLAQVEPSRNIKMGTAIGVALANAAGRLKDSKAKSRIIIFLTDGENNSGTIDPETALKIAKEYGLKVYSIGMGKDGMAQLPQIIEDARGRKIKQYRPMHSQVNEKLLRRFADETGGRFWRATSGKGLDDVFAQINRLERTKIDVNQFKKYAELFQQYLFWAIVFFLGGVFLDRSFWRRSL